jgi:hypothetical protein
MNTISSSIASRLGRAVDFLAMVKDVFAVNRLLTYVVSVLRSRSIMPAQGTCRLTSPALLKLGYPIAGFAAEDVVVILHGGILPQSVGFDEYTRL